MLENLHVKNLALIEEQDISFSNGLNILTGETGAGKSIVLGSIHLALGQKADKDIIRTGAEYALIELTFSLNEQQKREIRRMELPVEEDSVLLLQRKIMSTKSQCRINGETVGMSQLKELAGYLLNMYGQNEHQTLLKPLSYRKMLDQYIGEELMPLKKELKEKLSISQKLHQEWEEQDIGEEERQKEISLLTFELQEIEAANLLDPSEDETLEKRYHKLLNARRIRENCQSAHLLTGYEEEGAGNAISHALREMKSVQQLDEELSLMTEQLQDVENLLNDFNRVLSDYQESLHYEEEEFQEIEDRLNVINHLKSKYGKTIEEIQSAADNRQERLDKLNNHAMYLQELSAKIEAAQKEVYGVCREISAHRKEAAGPLAEKLKSAMKDLNFLDVAFEITVTEEESCTAEGFDQVEFLISTNPGEQMRPLWQIASGGELSRIMLSFKTVFADKEDVETLIFDEIDTGISGKTAWMVAEKMGRLAKNRQVICITHLPQIASMADRHFIIEKNTRDDRTVTDIRYLDEKESLGELSRLLGSGEITDAVWQNAQEMKKRAMLAKMQ